MTQQTVARAMHKRLAMHYLRFAQEEAPGACPIHAAVAEAVASSPEVLSFLPESPEHKRQSGEM